MDRDIKVFNIVIKAKWNKFIKWLRYESDFFLPSVHYHNDIIKYLIKYSFSNLDGELGTYPKFFIELILLKYQDYEEEDDTWAGYLELRDLSEVEIQIIGICEILELIHLFENIHKEISIAWETIRSEEMNDQIKFLPVSRYLPKKEETREKWKQAYAIYVDRIEKYKEEVLDGHSKKESPSLIDLKIAILHDMDYDIDVRTIRNIIRVGNADLLE